MHARHIFAYGLGGIEALLLARLVLRLLAARPDNPSIQLVLGITAPLIAPLAGLDTAQPRFGAVLELSTLALFLLLAVIGLVLCRLWRRSAMAHNRSSV